MSIPSVNPSLATTVPVSLNTTAAASASTATAAVSGSSSFFGDLLDTVNPLQHIPILSSLYRTITNTEISPLADIAGSTIYGGPIGGAIAAVSQVGKAAFHGIMGDTSATEVASAAPVPAVTSSAIEPAAGGSGSGGGGGIPSAKSHHHHHMHATTQDWLNQNLNQADDDSADSATDVASNVNMSAATNASNAYKKLQATTTDWLHPTVAIAPAVEATV